MIPPQVVRRLLVGPILMLLAALIAVLFLPVVLLAALVSMAFSGRYRTVWLMRFLLAWVLVECWAVFACLAVWLGSGMRGRVRAESYWDRHYAIVRRYVAALYRAAERYLHLRVKEDGSVQGRIVPGEGDDDGRRRPVIVLCRHAGPGDSLILLHHLLTGYGRRPRLVMKDFLQLAPTIDIAANRIPNVFVRKANSGTTAEIAALADRLGPEDALVIFPEGGNFTERRRTRAIKDLLRRRQPYNAFKAAGMQNVLPPKSGGALAAIDAARDADIVFVAHTGLDELATIGDVWRALPLTITVQAHWWRVPAAQVPRGREDLTDWLYDQWAGVDAWIAERKRPPGRKADA